MSSRSQTSTKGSIPALASRRPWASKTRLVVIPRRPGNRKRRRAGVGLAIDQREIVPCVRADGQLASVR